MCCYKKLHTTDNAIVGIPASLCSLTVKSRQEQASSSIVSTKTMCARNEPGNMDISLSGCEVL